MAKNRIIILLALLIGMSTFAVRAEPAEILKVAIDEIMTILKDPRYNDSSRKEMQRKRIWEVVQKHFDTIEMAKRALARNWRKFVPRERKEFAEVFAELLKNTYLDNIQGKFKNAKVEYLKEKRITDTKVIVKTKIYRGELEIPVDYSLRLHKETWRVYDVNVEGVSLIKNYRSQFNKILLKKSPAQLIDRLKKKVRKQREKHTG